MTWEEMVDELRGSYALQVVENPAFSGVLSEMEKSLVTASIDGVTIEAREEARLQVKLIRQITNRFVSVSRKAKNLDVR